LQHLSARLNGRRLAHHRYDAVIESALSIDVPLAFDLRLKEPAGGIGLIPTAFRDNALVVLNPARFFPSRNWPLRNYVEFATAWLALHRHAAFVVLGDARVAAKAAVLEQALPGRLLNLVGKTTVTQAFEVLQRATLVVSEDSGLLHMAWCSGRPSVALFGSTRSDWSRPLGPHSVLLDSSDMPCGNCMAPECRFGDVRCLTRYTPDRVLGRAP
jgi:ADP-heptose:LPS heptosyltransferase